MILRIARMRYDQRLPQNEIARVLALSESTVSRFLKAAMDLGFVEIQITSFGLRDFDLERRLISAYGLDLAVVVQPRASSVSTYEVLGRAVASVIEERIIAGTVLGVSDGDTVAAVAAGTRRARTAEIDVVSLIGGVGAPQVPSHSSEVCRVLANGLGGRAWQLPVPAIVDEASAAKVLLDTATVRSVFDLIHRMSIALVGIGSISPRATVFRHGVIDMSYIETIRTKGAIGTICGRFYGSDGQPIATEFDDRTLSVTLQDLRRAPIRIGAAIGEAKVPAIAAALKGGLLNGIAVDAETARRLIR
jgi:DNA-binding transcriptional regulator LsrR (DeoR family)